METLIYCSNNEAKNHKSFREQYPNYRSPRSVIGRSLFLYNHTTGYRTETGKVINKPSSKKVVSERVKVKKPYYISSYCWRSHEDGDLILYGYNTPNINAEYIIAMIDGDLIDKSLEICSIVEEELGAKIFWERSPSGNWHGYLFLAVKGRGDRLINQSLDRLNAFMGSLVYKYGWEDQIKELCVKGKVHEIDWNTHTVKKQYALYQLPATAHLRKDEFFDTSLVDVNTFMKTEWIERTKVAV